MQVLRGMEKAIFKIGDRLVKVARANRNGEVVLVITDDDSTESVEALVHHRLPEEGERREDRLRMPNLKTIVAALAILFCDWAYCQDAFQLRAVHEVREPTTNCPEVVNHEVRNHVVQVHVHGGMGSGIYLGDRIVLTAAHVVSGHRRARVNFPNPVNPKGPFHESVVGTVLATDRTWDQAVIELDLFPKHNPPGSPLAADNPKTGDKVTFAGYPGGRSLKMMRGQFERYSMASGQRTADWFDADAGVISGYSGGAAYSDDGTLFGNLWGSTGSSTVAVCLGRTKRFLLPWNARLEAWRLAIKSGNAGTMQWGNCPPGGCQPGNGGGPRYIEPGDDGDAPPSAPGQPGALPPSAPGGGGSLTPVPPPVTPPATSPVDLSGIESAIAKINARIDGLAAAKPYAEPSPYALSEDDVTTIVGQLLVSMEGNPAFRGPKGDDGKDGQPAKLDMDKITAGVLAKLPPVELQIHSQGKVATKKAPLGKPIAIGQKDRTKK